MITAAFERVARYIGWHRDPYAPPAQPPQDHTRPHAPHPTPEAAPTITQAPAGTTGTPPTRPTAGDRRVAAMYAQAADDEPRVCLDDHHAVGHLNVTAEFGACPDRHTCSLLDCTCITRPTPTRRPQTSHEGAYTAGARIREAHVLARLADLSSGKPSDRDTRTPLQAAQELFGGDQ